MPESQGKTFLRKWGVLIAFAVFVVIVLGGFRLWTEHMANESVAEPYRLYLNEVASNSKSAAAFLDKYYEKYSRHTVASRHFEVVCGAVTALATHDGFDPKKVSIPMARMCQMFIRRDIIGTTP